MGKFLRLMIKTFKQTTTEGRDDFLSKENHVLKTGVELVLARSALKHASDAETGLNVAMKTFDNTSDQNLETQMKTLILGLSELIDGLMSLRIAAVTLQRIDQLSDKHK
jgi:hypothetical protein